MKLSKQVSESSWMKIHRSCDSDSVTLSYYKTLLNRHQMGTHLFSNMNIYTVRGEGINEAANGMVYDHAAGLNLVANITSITIICMKFEEFLMAQIL